MTNPLPDRMPRQLDLLARVEPTESIPEANKHELINAFAQLVIEYTRHEHAQEDVQNER
jgi:hypothetical protein